MLKIKSKIEPVIAWSEIEVAMVRNKSRLQSFKSVQPLKLLNPSCDTAAHVVLSGYGGGLLAGDQVKLKIAVQDSAKLLITTQTNSRVFKSEDGRVSEQTIKGTLARDAFAVFFPDPLIPHEKSRIRQLQEWKLEKGAVILTVDWFSSGRSESGEQFLFSEYLSQIHVERDREPFLIDHSLYTPEEHNSRSKGVFGKYNHFMNGFLAGDEAAASFKLLKDFLLSLNPQANSGQENFDEGQKNSLFIADEVKPGLLSFRAMGIRRLDLEPFIRLLGKEMATEPILGFDFFKRRF